MRYFIIAALQCLGLWLVVQLWRTIGPIVGLPGLTLWMGAGYWLAWRWERQSQREWLEFNRAPQGAITLILER
jgi:hypothetical protein